MKKLMYIFGLLMFLVTLTHCGKANTPSQTVTQFYKSVSEGKVNEAYDLISQDAKKMLNNFGGASMLSEQTEKVNLKSGIKDIKVSSENIKGDIAEVTVKITYGNGEKAAHTEKLIKENGKWRITVSK